MNWPHEQAEAASLTDLESRFRRLAELRERRDEDALLAEQSENAYREYEAELYAELEGSPIKGSLRFDFGGDLGTIRFTPRRTVYGKIIDFAAAQEYFEEIGRTEQLTRTEPNRRRVNDLVRDLEDSGQELPPGISSYERKGITISKVKTK